MLWSIIMVLGYTSMLFWIPGSFDYKLKQYKNVLSFIDPIELGGKAVANVNVCV